MSDVASLLRAILSEASANSGDLIERWIDLYFHMARTFGIESHRHQPDLWVASAIRLPANKSICCLRFKTWSRGCGSSACTKVFASPKRRTAAEPTPSLL